MNNLCKNIPIKNQKNKIEVNVNQKVFISPEFKQLWNKINQKTIYQIHLDTDKLINNSIVDIDVKLDINSKKITITRAKLNIDAYGIGADLMHMDNIELNNSADIDVVKKIELATSLTRKTIIAILQSIKKEKLELINVNNVAFIEQVVDILNNQKIELLVSGIKYHKIADLGLSDSIVHIEECYAQSLIQQNLDYGYNDNIESNIANANELGISSDNLATKFLYDVLRYDSDVEFNFLKNAISQDKVKLITKLPSWFKINTPLGKYNPDWALLLHEDGKENVYFIAETKGDSYNFNGRPLEKGKTYCGEMHFIDTLGVEYKVGSDVGIINS